MRNLVAVGFLSSCSLIMVAASGCSASPDSPPESQATQSESSALGGLHGHDAEEGRDLFFNETFGGNGRTCGTCHTRETGTISPEQIQHLAKVDPHNPIFRPIDSDDGVGNSYERLKKNATIRITLDLPPNIRLHDNPTAKTFTVNRSTPTFVNSALFPQLMWDTREPNLVSQALGAVHAHTQNTIEPTTRQLDLIAAFEETQYTNEQIVKYARGGPAPTLPDGHTASEKRGRAFFAPDKPCGMCHDGPMLDISNANNPFAPPGSNVNTAFAGFEAALGFPQPPDSPNPIVVWDLDCPTDDGGLFCDGLCPAFGGTVANNVCTIPLPDLGQAIATGQPGDFGFFKTPSLWGVKNTAPYFHDNSALTEQDLMSHYDKLFQFMYEIGASTQNGFTAQEQTDIINYMNLL